MCPQFPSQGSSSSEVELDGKVTRAPPPEMDQYQLKQNGWGGLSWAIVLRDKPCFRNSNIRAEWCWCTGEAEADRSEADRSVLALWSPALPHFEHSASDSPQ